MKTLIAVSTCSFLLGSVIFASSLQEQNKALAKRAFEELLSRGRFELAEQLYAKDFANHGIHRDISLARRPGGAERLAPGISRTSPSCLRS